MARANDVLALVSWALKGDIDRVRQACKVIVANEKPESALRQSMSRLLQQPTASGVILSDLLPPDIKNLVIQIAPKLPLSEVMLPREVEVELVQFIKEREHADVLRSAGLDAPHRILLSGPPGNGKTALAGAIATTLDKPFFVLDYSKAMGSHLGETGRNLAKIFRSLATTPCVLFIDEMETVLAERNGGRDDVGEMARVVSAILLEIDRLPVEVVLIGATNHCEMLDRAVVRRFEHHWKLPAPTCESLEAWLDHFAERYPSVPVKKHKTTLIGGKEGWSFSDIERSTMAWCRQWIIENYAKSTDLQLVEC